MRDDRIPKKRLGPRELNRLRGLVPSLMEYNQLVTLQQRLDALENVYNNAHPYDEGILVPRIAKVAPMLAEPKRRDPPVNVQRAPAPPLTVEESIQELSSPEHAAGAPEPTKERANARDAAVECLRSSLYAPKRDTTYPTAYSATSPTNTTTYSAPVNMALHYGSPAFPPYYSVASTSSSSIGSTINSPFATANGATTDRAPPSDFQAFCNIYNAYQESNDYQECNDEEMDEQPVPRKMAKRSEQHMTVVKAEFSSNRGFNGGINGGFNGGSNGGFNGGFNGGSNGGFNGGSNGGFNGGSNSGFNGGFNGGSNGGFKGDHNYAAGDDHNYANAGDGDEEMMDCSHFE